MRPGQLVTQYIGTAACRQYVVYRVNDDLTLKFIAYSGESLPSNLHGQRSSIQPYVDFDAAKAANDGEYPFEFWVSGGLEHTPNDLLPSFFMHLNAPVSPYSYQASYQFHAVSDRRPSED